MGEYPHSVEAATAASGGTFVALRGFEYTQGAEGHINVYNTQAMRAAPTRGATNV